MNITKRRLGVIAAAVGSLGAVVALGLGGTSALFTSDADGQHNVITAGTVTLTRTANHELNVTNFMPGDTTDTSYYELTYEGAKAFVGVDLKITSIAAQPCAAVASTPLIPLNSLLSQCTGTGQVPMFNGDQSSGSLDLAIDPQNGNTAHQLLDPGDLEPGTTCSGDSNGYVSCTVEKKNVIVPPSWINGVAEDLVWNDGHTHWMTVAASLPVGAPNTYQGSNVTIDLVAHAVQFANNADLFVNTASAGTIPANGVVTSAPVLFPKSW